MNYRIRFGHSLWSAISCQRKWLTSNPTSRIFCFQNCSISSVLSIFKYNPGKTNDKFVKLLFNNFYLVITYRRVLKKKATNYLYTVWSLVMVRNISCRRRWSKYRFYPLESRRKWTVYIFQRGCVITSVSKIFAREYPELLERHRIEIVTRA